MMSRLSLAFLSAVSIYGLSAAFAPQALAAGCDVNVCISTCQKRGPAFAAGQACTSGCLQTMDKRKKAGQCK
jgi:hypothetical protein